MTERIMYYHVTVNAKYEIMAWKQDTYLTMSAIQSLMERKGIHITMSAIQEIMKRNMRKSLTGVAVNCASQLSGRSEG